MTDLKACREAFEKWADEMQCFGFAKAAAWGGWKAAWNTRPDPDGEVAP